MITFILLILSCLGILEFSWWAPLVEGALLAVLSILLINESNTFDSNQSIPLSTSFGALYLSSLALFCNATINPFLLLISPLFFLLISIAFILPAGFTILNYLISNIFMWTVPLWYFILGIILDIISFIILVWLIINIIKEKKQSH